MLHKIENLIYLHCTLYYHLSISTMTELYSIFTIDAEKRSVIGYKQINNNIKNYRHFQLGSVEDDYVKISSSGAFGPHAEVKFSQEQTDQWLSNYVSTFTYLHKAGTDLDKQHDKYRDDYCVRSGSLVVFEFSTRKYTIDEFRKFSNILLYWD